MQRLCTPDRRVYQIEHWRRTRTPTTSSTAYPAACVNGVRLCMCRRRMLELARSPARLGVQSQVQLCCPSAGTCRSQKSQCLPAKCLAQAGVSQRPGGGIECAVRCCLALHTAHAACIAFQALPEREGRNERRVAYGRVGLASAQIMYERCAYSCTRSMYPLRGTP